MRVPTASRLSTIVAAIDIAVLSVCIAPEAPAIGYSPGPAEGPRGLLSNTLAINDHYIYYVPPSLYPLHP